MQPLIPSGHVSEVAVVGPEDSVSDLVALNAEFPGLRLRPYVYENEHETVSVYQQIDPAVRVVLFTGPVPYYRVTGSVGAARPMLYVPFTGVALYRALFQLHQQYDVTCISVDTVERGAVLETYADLGLSAEGIYTLEYSQAPDRGEFVKFHRRHHESGLTAAALTCLRSAHRALQEEGIPCTRIIPTHGVLMESLERAFLVAENIRTGENQIVVGIVDVGACLRAERAAGSYSEVQRKHLALQSEILHFVQEVDGHFTPTGGDEYLFHTTQGPFLRASGNLRSIPLLRRLKALGPEPVFAGIGMSYTAAQAGTHARMALEHARRQGSDACFVVTEDRRVVGPLGSPQSGEFQSRTLDPQRLELARIAGVSPTSLERLIGAVHSAGIRAFTANEVAPWLHITDRSARRLLRQLGDAGVVRVVGEETHSVRGRPRQVFQLAPDLG